MAVAPPARERAPLHRGIPVAFTVLALLLVWAALVSPNQVSELDAGAFVRLPLELLVVLVLAVLLPAAPRRVLAVVAGTVLALLMVVKVLDMGFITAFDRPFDPISDSTYVGIGVETLRDAIGRSSANLALAVIVVILLGLLALPVLALLRVTRVAAGHRDWVLRGAVALGVVWVALRLVGAPVASTSAAALAVDEVQTVQSGLAAQRNLAREIPRDRFASTPGDRLLTGLRGKDVLLLFVESYGQVAVQGSSFSPRVNAISTAAPSSWTPAASPRAARSCSSSTFGGLSWLARATLQSGCRSAPSADNSRRSDPSRSAGRWARRLADGRRTRRTSARGPRARASTATTRSTTTPTSATAARASACPRCPIGTR